MDRRSTCGSPVGARPHVLQDFSGESVSTVDGGAQPDPHLGEQDSPSLRRRVSARAWSSGTNPAAGATVLEGTRSCSRSARARSTSWSRQSPDLTEADATTALTGQGILGDPRAAVQLDGREAAPSSPPTRRRAASRRRVHRSRWSYRRARGCSRCRTSGARTSTRRSRTSRRQASAGPGGDAAVAAPVWCSRSPPGATTWSRTARRSSSTTSDPPALDRVVLSRCHPASRRRSAATSRGPATRRASAYADARGRRGDPGLRLQPARLGTTTADPRQRTPRSRRDAPTPGSRCSSMRRTW